MKRVRAHRLSRRRKRSTRPATSFSIESLEQRVMLQGDPHTHTVAINISPLNQAPFFTKGNDPTVFEDSGAQTIAHWATGISPGPANEHNQSLKFIVSSDNPTLFSSAPKIDSDGKLHFTPAPNANGIANVTVRLMDNGGTANGGVDTSAPQTFVINVTAVNDRPAFTKGKDQTVLEDSGPTTVSMWAKNIVPGPANESSQQVTFLVSNNNASLFFIAPSDFSQWHAEFYSGPQRQRNGEGYCAIEGRWRNRQPWRRHVRCANVHHHGKAGERCTDIC